MPLPPELEAVASPSFDFDLNATALAELEAIQTPYYQEIVRIQWGPASSQVRYYGNIAVDHAPPFANLKNIVDPIQGDPNLKITGVQARIGDGTGQQKWIEYEAGEFFGDTKISLELGDEDGEITELAQIYGEAQRFDLFGYYPQITAGGLYPNGYLVPLWWGFMGRANEIKRLVYSVDVEAGMRSSGIKMPRRLYYPGCQFIFGGTRRPDGTRFFRTLAETQRNACVWAADIGGEGIAGFTTCPRNNPNDCAARFGHTRYYGGFDVSNHVYALPSRFSLFRGTLQTFGRTVRNDTIIKRPIRVVYGARWVREVDLLASSAEILEGQESKGFVRTLFPICEGRVKKVHGPQIGDVKPLLNQYTISGVRGDNTLTANTVVMPGAKGQPPIDLIVSGGSLSATSLSLTAFIRINFNWGGWGSVIGAGSSLKLDVYVEGKNDVRTWSLQGGVPTESDEPAVDSEPETRRSWVMLDMVRERRYGYGMPLRNIKIEDFIKAAEWGADQVKSVNEAGDQVIVNRTECNADFEGTEAGQLLDDICRAGHYSKLFYWRGKIRFRPLGLESLINVPEFRTEANENGGINITPGTLKIVPKKTYNIDNRLKVSYDDVEAAGYERNLIFEDLDLELQAGFASGDDTIRPKEKAYAATGLVHYPQVARHGKWLMDVGPFEEGGKVNPFTVSFQTYSVSPEALLLYPAGICKIVDEKYNSMFEQNDEDFPWQYMRIQKIKRLADNDFEVSGTPYPVKWYADFEGGNLVYPFHPIVITDELQGKPIRDVLLTVVHVGVDYVRIKIENPDSPLEEPVP
jgi:hypothetical protein